MTNHIDVLLADGTTGKLDVTSLGINADLNDWIGEEVEITARDESGDTIRVTGTLEEVL